MTRARGAGRPRAILAKANRVEVIRSRRQLGSLAALRVGPRTARRYWTSLQCFFKWMQSEGLLLPGDEDEMDAVVSQYIELTWQEGEGRSFAADTVCGLQWVSPLLKRRLNGSWALLKAWQRSELPARAPPLPVRPLLALAEWLIRASYIGMALGILVAAHCVLRTGELVHLAFGQIVWAEDCASAVLNLGVTKGGARRGACESASVELPWLAAALKAWALTEPGPLVVGVPQHQFRVLFAQGLGAINCGDWGFVPYSLRRGGATEHWRQFGALDRITVRGRWAQAATTRIYINDGLAMLAEMQLPQEPVRELSDALCARFQCSPRLFDR